MTATASPTTSTLERLYSLGELEELGYGGRQANLDRIHAGTLPAVRVGSKAFRIRESDLVHLVHPVRTDADRPIARDLPTGAVASVDTLAELAAQVVSAWPRLSAERKAELGRLLAMSS